MESNDSGAAGAASSIEPLRLTIGEHAYDVPAERVRHLHRALVIADRTCTADGRAAHNAPGDRAAGVIAGEPHYLAAEVAGDLADWIARRTGLAADLPLTPTLPDPVEVPL